METPTSPPRNPASCKRGLDDRRPILCLPRSPGASSVLLLKLTPEVECEVHLAPRYTALLLALVDAWNADEGDIEILRGFRTAAELGRHYAEFSQVGDSISEEAVRAYVHELKVSVAKAVSSLDPHERFDIRVPVLLDARRLIGYRIGRCGLEIVQPRPREAFDN